MWHVILWIWVCAYGNWWAWFMPLIMLCLWQMVPEYYGLSASENQATHICCMSIYDFPFFSNIMCEIFSFFFCSSICVRFLFVRWYPISVSFAFRFHYSTSISTSLSLHMRAILVQIIVHERSHFCCRSIQWYFQYIYSHADGSGLLNHIMITMNVNKAKYAFRKMKRKVNGQKIVNVCRDWERTRKGIDPSFFYWKISTYLYRALEFFPSSPNKTASVHLTSDFFSYIFTPKFQAFKTSLSIYYF